MYMICFKIMAIKLKHQHTNKNILLPNVDIRYKCMLIFKLALGITYKQLIYLKNLN